VGHFRHTLPNAAAKVVIQATIDPADLNRCYRVDHALIGDAELALGALLNAWDGGPHAAATPLAAQLAAAREAQRARYRPYLESDEMPINPYRVYAEIMAAVDPRRSFVSPDSGSVRDQTSTIYPALTRRAFSAGATSPPWLQPGSGRRRQTGRPRAPVPGSHR
jgi:thiamine pyrophosphate-dependent acetolactate synthase large subunit-like protein